MEKKNMRMLLIATILMSALGARPYMYAAHEVGEEEDRKESAEVASAVIQRAYTPLMMAAENNNIDEVAALLAAGEDATVRDFKGYNALTYAACNGHVEIVQLLLREAGQDIILKDSVVDGYGRRSTLEMVAISCKDEACAMRVAPSVRLMVLFGMNLRLLTVNVSSSIGRTMTHVLTDALAEREVGEQDWKVQDLKNESKALLDEACSGDANIAALIADLTVHEQYDPFIQAKINEKIENARNRRLGVKEEVRNAEQVSEVNGAHAATMPESAAAEAELVSAAARVEVDELAGHYQGDGVRCSECGTVQPDEGFFDCNVCGAHMQ